MTDIRIGTTLAACRTVGIAVGAGTTVVVTDVRIGITLAACRTVGIAVGA